MWTLCFLSLNFSHIITVICMWTESKNEIFTNTHERTLEHWNTIDHMLHSCDFYLIVIALILLVFGDRMCIQDSRQEAEFVLLATQVLQQLIDIGVHASHIMLWWWTDFQFGSYQFKFHHQNIGPFQFNFPRTLWVFVFLWAINARFYRLVRPYTVWTWPNNSIEQSHWFV